MIQEIHDTRNETLETRNFLKKWSESEIPTNGMDFFLDGLKFQSSELSPPWLSAAGAFFVRFLRFSIFWIHVLLKNVIFESPF